MIKNQFGKFLAWFSCGITSTIACKIALEEYGDLVDIFYFETGAGHQDNERFILECQEWYGKEIKIARSNKFSSPLEVAKKEIFNSPYGAPCTKYLKKEVRHKIEKQYDNPISVMGFEYSLKEMNRALRWKEQNTPNVYFPLIERKLSKKDCFSIFKKTGIEIPYMYKLGYNNNNCIGCFKGGVGYWNKIRQDFPDIFSEIARVERETGHTCLKQNKKQLYLDSLNPNAGRHKSIALPDCGLFCDLELEGLREIKDSSFLFKTLCFSYEDFLKKLQK